MTKPVERAQEITTQVRDQRLPQAVSEMQRELRDMNPQQRQEFFNEFARQKEKVGGLPGLEIHGGDGEQRGSIAYEGQRPIYRQPDGIVRKNQGPYDALSQGHPEWSPEKVRSEVERFKNETGRTSVRPGEQIHLNNDGSVTLRNEHPSGKFDEVRYKDKKPVSSRHGDGKGNWTETEYGADGKPKQTTRHEQGKGGDYTETVTNAYGREISNKTRTTAPDGSYKERTTDPARQDFKETNYDANGKPLHSTERKYIGPTDKDLYSETRTDGDGKVVSKMQRRWVGEDRYSERTTPYSNGKPEPPVWRMYEGNKLVKSRLNALVGYTQTEDPERLDR